MNVIGKMHKDVMKAIRNMEPAWLKVNGRNFALVDYKDSKGELRPCYSLSKTECLYIATKFNDEARAKLVIRWQQLEQDGDRTGCDARGRADYRTHAGIIQPKCRRLYHCQRHCRGIRYGSEGSELVPYGQKGSEMAAGSVPTNSRI